MSATADGTTTVANIPENTGARSGHLPRCLVPVALALVAIPILCGRADAQGNLVRVAEPPFKETFVANPKVSGNILVGLSYGESDQTVDSREISIDLSASFSDRRVCAQISSRDGRYWAENVYALPKIRGSAQLEWGTRFASELGHFTYKDIAIVVRDVPNCLSSDLGAIIPTKMAGGDETKLVAYVNPGSARVKASLSKEGHDVVGATACNKIESGVRIAYSVRCVIPLPDRLASGRYDLRLSLKEAMSETPITMSVLIP